MAGSSFTFRCADCNRLLGVSRSRIGSTVQCPKCGVDLVVPDPDQDNDDRPETRGEPSSSSGESATVGAQADGAAPAFAGLSIEPEPLSLRSRESARPFRMPDHRAAAEPVAAPESAEGRLAGLRVEEPPLRELSPASLDPGARALARPGDVVLPRTALLLWSFVMLVALVMSFAAGVLAGHFLWTATPAAAPPGR